MHGDTMRIGEVAAEANVSIQTLRYYERRGLIGKPARRRSGYREYTPDVVRLVRLIKWAQQLGFTLDEIREMTCLLQNSSGGAGIRDRAAAKIEAVDNKIRDLQTIRVALQQIVDCYCEDECPIISGALERDKSA
jgi:MerR family copper efflux transcriptional regulator